MVILQPGGKGIRAARIQDEMGEQENGRLLEKV